MSVNGDSSMEDLNYEENLSKFPTGAEFGTLHNGLTYYVRRHTKPENSAALVLAVKVLEEEEERGVAHILEHMAFRGTKNFEDLVSVLESIGSKFGPPQNAYTNRDETVFEVFVPTKNPEALATAIAFLADISSEVIVSGDALEKERGVILQEFISENGRIENEHHLLIWKDSKYSERDPIGLETVIQNVSAEAVREFYRKWYQMNRMAIIVVGDFEDPQTVIDLIGTHFGGKAVPSDTNNIPINLVLPHEEFCVSIIEEPEESEIARVRVHGFSDQEISLARRFSAFEATSSSPTSGSMCEKYVEHFLHNEPVVYNMQQLSQRIFDDVSESEVYRYAENLRTTHNCVIEIIQPLQGVTADEVKNLVSHINSLEEKKEIPKWEEIPEEQVPEEEILQSPPLDGIEMMIECDDDEIGVTELRLSNGMRVVYKSTNFSANKVWIMGYAVGGLLEVPKSEYPSCVLGSNIAGKVGLFGDRQSALMQKLAEKMPQFNLEISPYTRVFDGSCTATDTRIEIMFQLVHRMFTSELSMPAEEEITKMMKMCKESIEFMERRPECEFHKCVLELKHGNCYALRATSMEEFGSVDLLKGYEYFNRCIKDPSTFTVAIVGNFGPTTVRDWIVKYLGGIPKPSEGILKYNANELKDMPYTFPITWTREVIHNSSVEDWSHVELTIPVELTNTEQDYEFLDIIEKLVKRKLMKELRFKRGQVYTVGVAVFLGYNKPSQVGYAHGDMTIQFSCDPDSAEELLDATLAEIQGLRDEGPSEADISIAVLPLQQKHTHDLQKGSWWVEQIIRASKSSGQAAIGASIKAQLRLRLDTMTNFTPEVARSALQRFLPNPVGSKYTAVIVKPPLPQED